MTDLRVDIPRQFTGYSLAELAERVAGGWRGKARPQRVVFNFAPLEFVRPSGVVFLSNLCYWLNEKGCSVSFSGLDVSRPAVGFLDDSLFFEQHCGHKLNPGCKPRVTTLPLIKIAKSDSHAWIAFTLVPWLSNATGIPEPSFYEIATCISEIFNNIQDHTRSDIGSVFVQHFPKEKSINISVSDFGDGIPHVVRTKLPELSDSDAILTAVTEGFTTKSTMRNQGAGLNYLLRTAVLEHAGVCR